MANFKTLMNDVGKVLQAAGVKSSAAGKFIGKFAKPIAFLSLVKEGDAYIKDLPIIGDLMSWRQGIQNKIFDSTFGKIPGVGPILTKISKFTQRELSYQPKSRHESKARTNDPDWYTEHLGIHSSFNIPAAYPDRFPIPVAGGTPRVQAAVFKMIYNPNPDNTSSRLRAEQKFALLKGIRGLSTVNYTPNDIANYEECVLACHAEYYGLKRAVKLMQRYDLMKSAWPGNLVSQLGYDPSDIRLNLAQYKGYLAQCANALHELPITGNMLEKIKLMQSILFPDCDDGTIATYYGYRLEFISAVIPGNGYSAGTIPDKLIKFVRSALASNNLLDVIMDIRSCEKYTYVVADYIGAFGASCLPAIPLDWDTPFEFNKYDENLLTQLQNTDILNIDAVVFPNDGAPDRKPVKMIALEHDGEWVSESGVPTDSVIDLYESKLDSTFRALFQDLYRVGAQANAASVRIPPVANFAGFAKNESPDANRNLVIETAELSVNLPKLGASEGLQLEYIQNKARMQSIKFYKEANEEFGLQYLFNTMSFFCVECTITYTDIDGLNKVNSIAHGHLFGNIILTSGSSNARSVLLSRTLISQCDWFPSVNYMVGSLSYPGSAVDFAVGNFMDWNIIGVLGVTGYEQAVSYSNFSLKAPAISAGGKTIDNIQEVFNNR